MLLLYFVVNLNAETCAYRFGRQMHPFLAKETQVAPCLRMSYIIGITFIACFHATKRRRTAVCNKATKNRTRHTICRPLRYLKMVVKETS